MIRYAKFLLSAVRAGRLYVDVDGCILERMPVPPAHLLIHNKHHTPLAWWMHNLAPTPRITRRLVCLWLMRHVLRVRLTLWTNRQNNAHHIATTVQALGHYWWNLFDSAQFHSGQKRHSAPQFPIMDDQQEYVDISPLGGLAVESLPVSADRWDKGK